MCGECSGLAASLPGLRRVDLEVNYRCPPPVVERAVRLVEHNAERFEKRIVAGPAAAGRLVLAPDVSDELPRIARAMATWPDDGSTRAVLARTNRELLPAVVAAVEAGIPFRAPDLPLPIDDERIDRAARGGRGRGSRVSGDAAAPVLGEVRRRMVEAEAGSLAPVAVAGGEPQRPLDPADGPTLPDLATALLGWAPARLDLPALRSAIGERRKRLADLRRDDAALTLATAHGTKGLEWDHVVVLADGFPGPSVHRRCRRTGACARGGAPSRVRRLDAGPAVAHAPV